MKNFFIILLSVLFVSCTTYYQNTEQTQLFLQEKKYTEAIKNITENKTYAKPKNTFLKHVELGTLYYLQGDYNKSTEELNAADYFEEDYNTRRDNLKELAVAAILNPAETQYRGEYFEKFMLHYYKALAYIQLNQPTSARVEIRRLQIRLQELKDKRKENTKKYATDAMAHILQGIVYEKNKEYNDAFISYREAYNIFVNNDSIFLGSYMPPQLKKDLLRTSKLGGLSDENITYNKIFKINEDDYMPNADGEAIIFWENGLAPVKYQDEFWFVPIKKDSIWFFYHKESELLIPFPNIDLQGFKPSDLGMIRVAFPKYANRNPKAVSASLTINETNNVNFSQIEDINFIARKSLQNRFLKDLGLALSRLAVTKVSEIMLKKNNKEGDLAKVAGGVIGILGIIKEKADTRSWLSLPNSIYYVRVPLKKGENTFTLNLVDGQQHSLPNVNFNINNDNKNLKIISIRTPESYPAELPQ